MARSTQISRSVAPGFAPEERQAPQLQVNAPLNVQAGPSDAEQLANALGLVSNAVQPALARKVQKDAFDATRAGTSDVALNQVDAKREAEDNLYARGVKFATKERAVRNALAEVEQQMAQIGADMSPAARATKRDELLKERLGDMVGDPESANIAAKLIAPWHQRNLAADSLEVIKEAQDKTLTSEGENVKDGMADGTFNYMESVKRLAPVIGRDKAVDFVIDSVGAAAVNLRDEELIKKFLPESITTDDGQTIDGPVKSQRHQAKLDQYKELARKARLEDASQQRRERKHEFEKDWIENPLHFNGDLYDHFTKEKDSIFTEDELNSYWRARNAEAERLKNASLTNNLRALYPDLRLRQLKGKIGADGKPAKEDDLQQIANEEIERSAFASGRDVHDVASEYTAREGYLYQPLANDLQKAPPSDTQLWGKATEEYFKLSPKVRELYVPDGEKRALFERTHALMGTGKKASEIGTMLDQQDDRLVRANLAAVDSKFNKKLKSLDSRVIDDGGFFGLSTSVGNLANAPAIRQEIKQRALERARVGTDAETAIASATEEVVNSYVLVPGPSRDKSILMPRTREITDGFGKTVSWFYQQLPTWLEANGYKQKASDVRLTTVPGSDQNTLLTLVDADGMPLSMKLRWRPTDLENERTRVVDNAAYTAVAEANRNRERNAHQRLINDSQNPRSNIW